MALAFSCVSISAFAATDNDYGHTKGTPGDQQSVNGFSNLAWDKDVFCDGAGYGNMPYSMNDGKYDTRCQSYGKEYNTCDFAGINFGSEVTFNKVVLYWETSYPGSTGYSLYVPNTPIAFVYAQGDVSDVGNGHFTALDGDEGIVTDGFNIDEWDSLTPDKNSHLSCGSDDNTVKGNKDIKYVDVFYFDTPVTADMLCMYTTSRTDSASIFEFEVYYDTTLNTAKNGESFTDMKTFEATAASGKPGYVDNFFVSNIDSSVFTDDKVVVASISVNRGGDVRNATVEITEAWGSISLTVGGTPKEFSKNDFNRGENEYVIGLILEDILSTDVVTVTFSVEDKA